MAKEPTKPGPRPETLRIEEGEVDWKQALKHAMGKPKGESKMAGGVTIHKIEDKGKHVELLVAGQTGYEYVIELMTKAGGKVTSRAAGSTSMHTVDVQGLSIRQVQIAITNDPYCNYSG